MLRLRRHARVELPPPPPGARPARWGRRVYFVLLLALAAWVADYAVGDAVFLRADGLVTSDRSVVAAACAGRVTAVNVHPGERVTVGQTLVELESPDMLRDIASLAGENARLVARETPLRVRAVVLAALVPGAERGAQESADVARRPERGIAALPRADVASGSAAETTAGLRGETVVLNRALSTLDALRARTETALSRLETFYAGGRVRAMHDGVVGAEVPAPGQVVRFGDALMAIRAGEAYVIARLPDVTLYGVAVGDRVALTAGGMRAEGTVETLLPGAYGLPPEVQGMVGSRDRGLLVKIGLPAGHPFAMAQKVRVRGCMFGWC